MSSYIRKRINKKITKALHDFPLIEEGDRVLVGVSGGKDSTALLLELANRRGKTGPDFELGAIHIQSDFADTAPRKFLQSLEKTLDIPFYYLDIIGFCKHTAAGSYRVDSFCFTRKLVETVGICFKQRCHLVNERSCTACTCSVHALFYTAAEICDFGILAAEFYDDICLRNYLFNSSCSRYDFLNKRNRKPLRYRQSARSCHFYGNSAVFSAENFLFKNIKRLIHNRNDCTAYIGSLTFIVTVDEYIIIIKNCDFYCCRAYVDADTDWK